MEGRTTMSEELNATRKNLSLNKALELLEIMVSYQRPFRLLDLANDSGLSTSTVHRFLKTYIDSGYVQQAKESKLYFMTLKLAGMGTICRQNYSLSNNLQSYLERITDHFKESSSLCIENDMNVVYIATQEGPARMLSTLSRIGKVAPMHCTGVGKIFLSQYTPERLALFMQTKGLPRFTEHTICDPLSMQKELNAIRERGYSWDNEECEVGARCLAVPVRDYTGSCVAALSFSCPVARFPENEDAVAFMKGISAEASRELGFRG